MVYICAKFGSPSLGDLRVNCVKLTTRILSPGRVIEKVGFPDHDPLPAAGFCASDAKEVAKTVAAGAESLRLSVGRRQTSSPNRRKKALRRCLSRRNFQQTTGELLSTEPAAMIILSSASHAMEISNRSAPAEHRNNN